MQLIGPEQIAGAGHGDGMLVAGAAFGDSEIVPALAPEQMRALDQAMAAALENIDRLADQPLGPGIILLGNNTGKGGVSGMATD